MKKYLLIATVTLGLTLTACSGGTKTTEAAPAAPATEQAAPAVTAPADSAAVPVDSASVNK
jgi:hypothetical protein